MPFIALAAGLGALSGVAWWLVVDLPSYGLGPGGRASIGERGLASFFASDAWFCLIGTVVGVGLGLAGWRRFASVGWPIAPVVAAAAMLAGLLCWAVGYRLGPGDFTPRLADAQPGDLVPIALTVRAKASLLVWPFAAVIPVLFGSSLGPDDEEPRPLLRRQARSPGSATLPDGGRDRSGGR